jgi:CheY-like chemotaxis protein
MVNAEKILIIEDDHDIRVAYRSALESHGLEIFSAANGRDGLQLLSKITPKLIILDISMPIMNGVEFLKVKDSHPLYKDIPVLIVTCKFEKEDILKKHMCLSKPVDIDQFTSIISGYVREMGRLG